MLDLITIAQLIGAGSAVVAAVFSVATWLREKAWERPVCFISQSNRAQCGALALNIEVKNGGPRPVSLGGVTIKGGTLAGAHKQDEFGSVIAYERTTDTALEDRYVVPPLGSRSVWCAVHFNKPQEEASVSLKRLGCMLWPARYRLVIRPAR